MNAAFERLRHVARRDAGRPILELFRDEPDRVERLTVEAGGLRVDLSKQPWSRATLNAALDVLAVVDLPAATAALFGGEPVNRSEGRVVLHPALRAPLGTPFAALGRSVAEQIAGDRTRMLAFAEAIRSGEARGATGRPFRTVLHIGIGGSDLGPRLVWEALRPLDGAIDLRFVANVDPAEIAFALQGLVPAETLVVVFSKTFTTQETLANAEASRDWLSAALGPDVSAHLAAVSAAPECAAAFGAAPERVFGFQDWVGGRYSLWSSVGLSCAIGLGADAFERLLAGAHAMDLHFRTEPPERCAPVLMALAEIVNRNALDRPARAVVPYAQRLRLLPAFLQQLEMESNGKRVGQDGLPVAQATAPVVFGEAGTNGQHAFFQLLHQGTDVIPVDIVLVAETADDRPDLQRKLLANGVAQAEALMLGRAAGPDEPHRDFPGDRPSTTLLMRRLEPATLGALIALYEHKTFVEGVLWGINSFDQWGVELGKSLAGQVLDELDGAPAADHDPSTAALIAALQGPAA